MGFHRMYQRLLVVVIAVAAMMLPLQASAHEVLADLFEKVNTSVVVVRTIQKKPAKLSASGEVRFRSSKGIGSGVLISKDGKILTASHVVDSADLVAVDFFNGQRVAAKVIGSAPRADVALLQLESVPEMAKPAPLGDSDKVRIGEQVMIVGTPYGLAHTMSSGYISGRVRGDVAFGGDSTVEVFQSDASVNTGNSGGPMFNLKGEVIGIVSAILSKSGGFDGISFIVTSNTAKKEILDHASFWMGLDTVFVDPALAKVINLPKGTGGLLIQHVARGSIADRLGLMAGDIHVKVGKNDYLAGGDIIIEILDEPLSSDLKVFEAQMQRFKHNIDELKKRELFTIKVIRNGEMKLLYVPMKTFSEKK